MKGSRRSMGPGRLQLQLMVALGATTSFGCRQNTTPEITVNIEDGKTEKVTFTPVSAFAEYYELPGDRRELRITLASYEAGCEHFKAPKAGQTLVTIVVATPPDSAVAPGVYPVVPTPSAEEPVGKAVAIPKVHIGDKSFLFQPGGTVKLVEVVLEDHGIVRGLLDESFSGNAEHSATTLRGSFLGRICRFKPAPES